MTTRILPTHNPSFPRSGNHLLQELLAAYFDDQFVTCDVHRTPDRAIERDSNTVWQKSHDLALSDPIVNDSLYVVQVRFPTDSICSLFNMACQSTVEDTPASWVRYAFYTLSYWLRFYRKWVLDEVPGRLIVSYHDLIDCPREALARVVEHVTGEPAPPERIAAVCDGRDISPRGSFRSFRYYGEGFEQVLHGLLSTTPGVHTGERTLDLSFSSDAFIPERSIANRPRSAA